ncbi:reactive intermediate/imine deaminase [Siphonobacter sp. BAB-5385]|uniref:Reactive intermediate/imine deaminase n=1 Tax=Siphonobacter curvatus TaxID=2094562 RepID=A0A2S7ILR0_9BACT|nr:MULTISPECIES: Rid family detoxifying hydrolase [Siphonobacter]OZI08404.1 reactive intermediate/imine deaminase [Siphonobacter sp. BAB-5385]PMD97140.1 reactive intermediate/imine deaminase [Siphonobacter sp. BAB-5405]PQA58579.1 reactive intermediate/imine deaminase [Siphonobacter curvatus]
MNKQIIFTPNAPAPIGPYSQAVKIDGRLYVSGQIAADLAASQAGIQAEARQVMVSIGEILHAAGMNYHNIVKTTIFLKDMNDFAEVNAIYGEFFSGDYPARETVQVSRLPKDVSVEISVVALID